MNRCRMLLFTTLVLGSGALISGTTAAFAAQDQPATKAELAAKKALEKKAELLKKRRTAQKFVQKVIDDQAQQEKAAGSATPEAAAPYLPDQGGGAK